jgi:hypothetical protein
VYAAAHVAAHVVAVVEAGRPEDGRQLGVLLQQSIDRPVVGRLPEQRMEVRSPSSSLPSSLPRRDKDTSRPTPAYPHTAALHLLLEPLGHHLVTLFSIHVALHLVRHVLVLQRLR